MNNDKAEMKILLCNTPCVGFLCIECNASQNKLIALPTNHTREIKAEGLFKKKMLEEIIVSQSQDSAARGLSLELVPESVRPGSCQAKCLTRSEDKNVFSSLVLLQKYFDTCFTQQVRLDFWNNIFENELKSNMY